MIQDLERIEYRHGMLEGGMAPEELPVKRWEGPQIPSEIREAIREENILNLGGKHGIEGLGDPPEYDHLRLVLTDDVVDIEVHNRGISLFCADDDELRRTHRVLCKLKDADE